MSEWLMYLTFTILAPGKNLKSEGVGAILRPDNILFLFSYSYQLLLSSLVSRVEICVTKRYVSREN